MFGRIAVSMVLCTALGLAADAPKNNATEPSLVSLASGAMIVQHPQEYGSGWSAFWITDERADTGWATPQGVTSNQVLVIEMAQKSVLQSLEFDTARVDGKGRAAKDVVVEVSNSSAKDGFRQIAAVTLKDETDGQKFAVAAEVPGRWVRLTVKDNYGDKEYLELMDFRAQGRQLTNNPLPDVSGTYATNYGDMHIRQQGSSMIGCYEHSDGRLQGGIEGRVMRLTWRQDNPSEGPAIMVFSGDGQTLFGLWWYKGQESGRNEFWTGTKKSKEIGSCPHWSGDVGQQMASDLEQYGKALVYGIVFDTDSDRIKDESKSTLDKIVTMLKAKPTMRLSVEGHTDSTGGDEHNNELSRRRAQSVVAYLTAAGIEASKLSTKGFGSSHPVTSNDTALGRAQNRRVELVKQ